MCFMELSPATQVEKLPGWESLSSPDQATVRALVKKVPSAAKTGKGTGVPQDKQLQSTSRAGTKRKKDDAKRFGSGSKIEAQNKDLWTLKDDLKKHFTTAELHEMLEANGQDATGSELDLRDHCADGMCSSRLQFSGGMYRCHGYLSAWSKCSYSSYEPEHVKGKWKVPNETNTEYLSKWFKSQKIKKPVRLLPPSASSSQAANGQFQTSKVESLADLKVSITILPQESMIFAPQEEWKGKIKGVGGIIHAKIKDDTNCFVVSGKLDDHDAEVRKARMMKLPIVREDYLVDCFKRQKKLPIDLYKVEAIGWGKYNNTTLNMSDLSTGVNSYYILQIIQEDKASDCYVFRKLGRVGNEEIGGSKLEEMSKLGAISEFKRLFLKKTGNTWEAWEQKQNFQKQPGRFFPLDIVLAAMMEFKINMSEMPLGKLSKSNIQKGVKFLLHMQSRNFSDHISLAQMKMLESFEDIAIASRLVGFDDDSDDSLDEKYKKLNCVLFPFLMMVNIGSLRNISLPLMPLLILIGLLNWREYSHLKDKENLKSLLLIEKSLKTECFSGMVSGSWLTNFVGILSQGLRIAPPQVPATGYMVLLHPRFMNAHTSLHM
ncbi:Poly(ADP-ribose) polymerase 2, putative isoform 2 [Theobroma cacao]|uniref:Poly(ADP-ribose) polymerase 2, putative isoform 2 n=1 Tax=Theobroma cacao TaxID=3641 RepID=A0A061DQX6_THECC|nr:Poly(ADP-ribose) polymerase 2, putative isoform 2 [Theobroma cacao]